MSDFKVVIGERLHYLRKKRKYPVQYILDRLNIARSTYTCWEMGTRSPNGERLVQLANLFGTTVDYITGKTDMEEQPDFDVEYLFNSTRVTNKGKPLSEETAEQIKNVVKALLNE